jgi:quercetin dioxygenase-like cupin family protein
VTHVHVIEGPKGDTFDLGAITLRLLAGTDQTNGAFALGEFSGGEGSWTVPHVHQSTEESFHVLDGAFTFTLGVEEIEVGPGSFVLVARGTRHEMRAASGGGRLLTLWTPGGLEAMFVELSRMPAGSLRDPEARKAISMRFDSIPA